MNTLKLKQAGLRLLKVVGAAVMAGLIAFLSGPDVANVFGDQMALLLVAVLTPVLSAVEKYLTGPTVKVDA